ncbi:MAG: hypothetical protein EP310_00835 [Bacteroidetes bacterium]|nr:MAG: hypothetical protein EP310_00835 [Bacteroidota bacterium]
MKKHLLLLILLLTTIAAVSQSKFSFNGYLKELSMYYKPVSPMILSDTDSLDFLFLSQIHNRLNFKWYATQKLTFDLEMRNRLFFGQMVKKFPGYEEFVNTDNGYLDLGVILISQESWFLHSAIDRAWVDYTLNKLQFRVGRQRINWGINLVWNPNDIFNTYSYFDFDYEERPGTDGVKIQYYTSETSSAELVYKIGRNNNEMAAAGMYRFSKLNTDFQVLGGWMGKDFVLGGGWSGNIKGGGFRGEVSWFIPRESNNGSYEALVASVSGDYFLKNSLYLHGGVLYNSHGTTGKAGGRSFFAPDISAKMLSLGRYNLFGQISYPFTPLFSGNFSTILNPCDGSFFVGPALTYSLSNNWELMINGQLFFGDSGTEYGDYGQAVYGRVRWSF